MSPQVEPCDATLGAVVTNVRLAELSDDEWHGVEQAFNDHGVLIFPDQHLNDDQQVAFGQRFGPIEHVVGESGIAQISNQHPNGDSLDVDHPVMEILRGNEGWHTDSSYMPLAAKASMLSARVVPATGGQTGFADMRAAYEALAEATRDRIADLNAYHSLRYSQAKAGFRDDIKSYGYDVADVPLRPLVKVHPDTGRPSLFIGRHAHAIPGLSVEESDTLLASLLHAACQPPRILEHSWTPGDLVVWDNRCVLHRARPYDYAEPRVLHHTRIAGNPATESALAAQ